MIVIPLGLTNTEYVSPVLNTVPPDNVGVTGWNAERDVDPSGTDATVAVGLDLRKIEIVPPPIFKLPAFVIVTLVIVPLVGATNIGVS